LLTGLFYVPPKRQKYPGKYSLELLTGIEYIFPDLICPYFLFYVAVVLITKNKMPFRPFGAYIVLFNFRGSYPLRIKLSGFWLKK